MKKQQVEGVVMAWLSPIECGAQRCFQSEFVHMKTSTSKVSPRKCSFLNEMSCVQTLPRLVLRFVHMKIQQKEEEQSVANNRTGKE